MTLPPVDAVSRREFFRHTAAGAAVGGVFSQAQPALAREPNSRLQVAVIGTGLQGQSHLDRLLKLQRAGRGVEVAAVCDVYRRHREKAAEKVRQRTGQRVIAVEDYRELLGRGKIDLVCIATPDHWHARMTVDALAAGCHVYCETPFTHTAAEAQAVLAAWQASGRCLQVGVQRTSDDRWRTAYDYLCSGQLGQVLQAQTEYFRNSRTGQWRQIGLSRDMTPANVNWPLFLGREHDLAPDQPFDRARFAQWRCYWDFSSGLFSELFVPRVTPLFLALGLRYPARVTATGGIFWERDGRQVPDTATLVADFREGCQLLVTSTLGNDHPIEQCIRGHHGTLVFPMDRDGFDVRPERPQVTRRRDAKVEHISAARPADELAAHWDSFLGAIAADDPLLCTNTPELGAAAVTLVQMGVQSYRQGRMVEWDPNSQQIIGSGPEFARHWEEHSQATKPEASPGWLPNSQANSQPQPQAYQKLAGPWLNNRDPAG